MLVKIKLDIDNQFQFKHLSGLIYFVAIALKSNFIA